MRYNTELIVVAGYPGIYRSLYRSAFETDRQFEAMQRLYSYYTGENFKFHQVGIWATATGNAETERHSGEAPPWGNYQGS